MQMSDTSKENWKYLIGSVGAISLLILTMLGQQYVYETREQNKKINAMYDYMLVQGVRDSARNIQFVNLQLQIESHKDKTNTAIESLMQSMLAAQEQLAEIKEMQLEVNKRLKIN
jgi:hypothetical protein